MDVTFTIALNSFDEGFLVTLNTLIDSEMNVLNLNIKLGILKKLEEKGFINVFMALS